MKLSTTMTKQFRFKQVTIFTNFPKYLFQLYLNCNTRKQTFFVSFENNDSEQQKRTIKKTTGNAETTSMQNECKL